GSVQVGTSSQEKFLDGRTHEDRNGPIIRSGPGAFALRMRDKDSSPVKLEVLQLREANLLATEARRREERHEEPGYVTGPSLDGIRRNAEPFQVRRIEYANGLRHRSRESDVLVLPEVRDRRVSVPRQEAVEIDEVLRLCRGVEIAGPPREEEAFDLPFLHLRRRTRGLQIAGDGAKVPRFSDERSFREVRPHRVQIRLRRRGERRAGHSGAADRLPTWKGIQNPFRANVPTGNRTSRDDGVESPSLVPDGVVRGVAAAVGFMFCLRPTCCPFHVGGRDMPTWRDSGFGMANPISTGTR